MRTRLLCAQLVVLIFVYLSQRMGFYYFDVDPNNGFFAMTHFLGGVWVAFLMAWLEAVRRKSPNIVWCVAAAFTVGIFWELFEITADLAILDSPQYASDTVGDIAMDTLGGLFGGVLAVRSRLFSEK